LINSKSRDKDVYRYVILVLFIGVCLASNFVVNGNFELPLTNGWTQYISNGYGGITRGTGYHPDPDYEAYVYRQGSGGLGGGYERLYQTIDIVIPLTYIDFDFFLGFSGTDPYVLILDNTVYDPNGRIDPGETSDFTATLPNIGGAGLTNVNTTIETSSPYITINDDTGYLGDLPIDSIKENTADPYTVTVDTSTPEGTPVLSLKD